VYPPDVQSSNAHRACGSAAGGRIVGFGVYSFYTSKGYTISRNILPKALDRIEVSPDFPPTSGALQNGPEVLLREKKISAIPSWSKALRPDLWARASA
jgi:hypothetical protein